MSSTEEEEISYQSQASSSFHSMTEADNTVESSASNYVNTEDVSEEQVVLQDCASSEGYFGFPFRRLFSIIPGFKDQKRDIFLPQAPVNVKVTQVKMDREVSKTVKKEATTFNIELTHASQTWSVFRQYSQLLDLQTQLRRRHIQLRKNVVGQEVISKTERETKDVEVVSLKALPRLRPRLADKDAMAQRMEHYLFALLNNTEHRNDLSVLKFIEASHLTFIPDLYTEKMKEGLVLKRGGGRHYECLIHCSCNRFRRRWLVVHDTYVAYVRPRDGLVASVILFDTQFEVSSGQRLTGYRKGLMMCNSSRNLLIKCSSEAEAKEWESHIRHVTTHVGAEFLEDKRYNSFSPKREESQARWLVDGESYFSLASDAIHAAVTEIYITDWWLSPEVLLKRPLSKFSDKSYRLDLLLQRKAEEGVHIFVLVYREVSMALGLESFYVKTHLESMHRNIRVIRHPQRSADRLTTLMWANHEKMIVVDQCIALMGGFDLCFGRWDNWTHRLTDLGAIELKYDFTKREQKLHKDMRGTNLIESMEAASPFLFQDAIDLLLERQEQLTANKKSKDLKHGNEYVIKLPKHKKPRISKLEQITRMRKNTGSKETVVSDPDQWWVGKDYVNFIFEEPQELDKPFEDQIDRGNVPRMPWHDIGCALYGKAARDVARHFIQRWNYAKLRQRKFSEKYPLLLPRTYQNINLKVSLPGIEDCYLSDVQVLRSGCMWSVGCKVFESSIHTAYITAIENSEKFIFIENQFFISIHDSVNVQNKIASALYTRICRAHNEDKKFKVYVIIPLLPEFEGKVGEPSGADILAITHWNYQSICRGKRSLLERLSAADVPHEKYICFCSLRTHGELPGNKLVTELVYVHSKLMIVDDRVTIIGSANINDRSMMGTRDSELAVFIEDTEFVTPSYDSDSYEHTELLLGKFSSSLRYRIFSEHLGLGVDDPGGCNSQSEGSSDWQDIDLKDPSSDSFFHAWFETARKNTEIYENVFNCFPNDNIHTFSQLKQADKTECLADKNVLKSKTFLKDIRGLLVCFPLEFLKDVSLMPHVNTKEFYVPQVLFT